MKNFSKEISKKSEKYSEKLQRKFQKELEKCDHNILWYKNKIGKNFREF